MRKGHRLDALFLSQNRKRVDAKTQKSRNFKLLCAFALIILCFCDSFFVNLAKLTGSKSRTERYEVSYVKYFWRV